jgi:hypothetical protein
VTSGRLFAVRAFVAKPNGPTNCRMSCERGLFVSLRLSRDRHLEHAIALVGEQIIGFLDLFEFEAMGD